MARRTRLNLPETDDDGHYRSRIRDRTRIAPRTRSVVKVRTDVPEGSLRGTVVTAAGPSWIVSVGDDLYVCTLSGTVSSPHFETLVTVGDYVHIVPDGTSNALGDATATIVAVEERRTLLFRKAVGKARKGQVVVANVDRLCIVVAFVEPDYHRRLIDRYLIAADKGDLDPMIVLNKCELIPAEYRQDIVDDFQAYVDIGIPVHFVSAVTGEGLEELRADLIGVSTLFSGPSGVGKSSLINVLTESRQRVGAVSRKYEKGRHTTTAAVVIPLPDGGTVVDSPGIREFGMWELDLDELPWYFEEFAPFAPSCRFSPCTHTHEPGCAVKQAVDEGEIDPQRYDSYLQLREELTS